MIEEETASLKDYLFERRFLFLLLLILGLLVAWLVGMHVSKRSK